MNGSKDSRASDASDKPERDDTVLSLQTVQRMLPLVRKIVDDILGHCHAVSRLQPEEEILDDSRRSLAWPQRRRRYQVKDDLAKAERDLHEAITELRSLGVVLFDRDHGAVGFPTMVNNRRAYFAWQPPEESLQAWFYADEDARRPIPASWLKEVSLSGKS